MNAATTRIALKLMANVRSFDSSTNVFERVSEKQNKKEIQKNLFDSWNHSELI